MKSFALGSWAWFLSLLAVSTNAWTISLNRLPVTRLPHMRWQRATTLLAKKKSLISEDLYASFDQFDDDESSTVKEKHKNKPQPKEHHIPPLHSKLTQVHESHYTESENLLIEDEVITLVASIDDELPVVRKKNKGRNRFEQEDQDLAIGSSEIHITTHDLTQAVRQEKPTLPHKEPQLVYQNKHQKHHQQNQKDKTPSDQTRKDKPNSKVRFTSDSSQPDYVSMGLEKVSLMFGDVTVLKDATFSVSSGERVGLVGPNGGGKVSLCMCLLLLLHVVSVRNPLFNHCLPAYHHNNCILSCGILMNSRPV